MFFMMFHRARVVSLDSSGACGWALFLPRSSRNYPQICCTPPSMLSRTMLSPVQPDAPHACYNASIPWAVAPYVYPEQLQGVRGRTVVLQEAARRRCKTGHMALQCHARGA